MSLGACFFSICQNVKTLVRISSSFGWVLLSISVNTERVARGNPSKYAYQSTGGGLVGFLFIYHSRSDGLLHSETYTKDIYADR
jgi:hypothetical protein